MPKRWGPSISKIQSMWVDKGLRIIGQPIDSLRRRVFDPGCGGMFFSQAMPLIISSVKMLPVAFIKGCGIS